MLHRNYRTFKLPKMSELMLPIVSQLKQDILKYLVHFSDAFLPHILNSIICPVHAWRYITYDISVFQ